MIFLRKKLTELHGGKAIVTFTFHPEICGVATAHNSVDPARVHVSNPAAGLAS
jgi:hypothetical protein